MEKYNGWANRETWLVNLHYDDHFTDDAETMLENTLEDTDGDVGEARHRAIEILASNIEECVLESSGFNELQVNGLLSDLIGDPFAKVDWEEIAKAYIDEIVIYAYGFNMPGYMPDSAPGLSVVREDAIDSLIVSMEHAAEANDQAFDAEAHKTELARVGQVSFGAYVYWVTQA